MRILLVEDDQMIGDAVCAALRQWGYAVDLVTNGQASEAALAAEHFDMVLLVLALLVAFLTGGIILKVLKEELPEERKSKFAPFLAGAGGYAVPIMLI